MLEILKDVGAAIEAALKTLSALLHISGVPETKEHLENASAAVSAVIAQQPSTESPAATELTPPV